MTIFTTVKMRLVLIISVAVFFPSIASASTVYIEANHSSFFVGDTIVFTVRIDTEGKEINAVEGTVVLSHPPTQASLVNLNTSNTYFPILTNKPLPSPDNTSVSFSGGTIQGSSSTNAPIFNIALRLEEPGALTLSPRNFRAYIHDGLGTEDTVRFRDTTITVLPKQEGGSITDDLNTILSQDTTPPEPFEIIAGQDETVFGGKKFLSFITSDSQSGIAFYEVIEGALQPVRSDNTYILIEQSAPVRVTVIAHDSAGNKRESVYTSDTSQTTARSTRITLAILVVIVALLGLVVYKKTKNKNESAL